jgi:glucuronate isomerase
MLHDRLAQDLYSEICRIPLIDAHTHIDPHRPAARSLDEILSYHYFTELAHSVGLDRETLSPAMDPRERARAMFYHLEQFDNTAQYTWLLEIARAFFNFQGKRLTLADCGWLWETAERRMAQPNWEAQVLATSNLEKVFLTNDFDDPLEGFDATHYIPCLRTDELVFGLHRPAVQERLARAAGIEVTDASSLLRALGQLFQHFTRKGARACAISLPPDFAPQTLPAGKLSRGLAARDHIEPEDREALRQAVFWSLAEQCQEFHIPFDLMIGVNRAVYPDGVQQGQDLFDQRTSLIQYATLFTAFPEVTFCVSVLTSVQNQELASYSWIFPNVVTSGHWWYSNLPIYIEHDARARLQAVPKTKQIGYYSDMYKLEFALPKYNMYRRILARILADDFIRPRRYSESQALELARLLLRDNVRRIFSV